MTPVLLALMACNSCVPGPPSWSETGEVEESEAPDSPVDTVESPPIDTSPTDTTPALCDMPETEPNSYLYMETLPLNTWACGVFDSAEDEDWFTFSTEEDGWVMIDAQAAARGSNANLELNLYAVEADATVDATYNWLSSDVYLVFYNQADSYQIDLYEQTNLYGEDYTWFLMAGYAKAPVTWSDEEEEPNDEEAEANPFPIGETFYGVISESNDSDWYSIVVEACDGLDNDGDGYADEDFEDTTGDGVPDCVEGDVPFASLEFQVSAQKYGSAANMSLVIYDSAGIMQWEDFGDGSTSDPDPLRSWKAPAPGTYHLRAYNDVNTMGSIFHWYTLSITVGEETDTGA